MAGIMIGDGKGYFALRTQAPLPDQLVQELAEMHDLLRSRPELPVVRMEALEAAGAGNDDCLDTHAGEIIRPLPRFVRKRAVAHSPELAHAARLILAQDRKFYSCLLKQPRRLHGHG